MIGARARALCTVRARRAWCVWAVPVECGHRQRQRHHEISWRKMKKTNKTKRKQKHSRRHSAPVPIASHSFHARMRWKSPASTRPSPATLATSCSYSAASSVPSWSASCDATSRLSIFRVRSWIKTAVRVASAALGGKGGGGRPDMAQAGGPDAGKADAALDAVADAMGS